MSVTTNYGWTKPTVGGDGGAWGGELNADLDGIDATVFAVSGVANAALPKAGGALTGQLSTKGVDYPATDLGNISGGTLTLDLSLGNYFRCAPQAAITSIVLTNVPASGRLVPFFIEFQNAGGFAITWGSWKFAGGTKPTLTTTGIDILAFITRDHGVTVSCVGFQLNES